jgi:hypothetical protein
MTEIIPLPLPSSCKNFNNMNSFLAIVIGLMSGPVTRLRQTWKELPPRLKTRFDQFQALTVSQSIHGANTYSVENY